MFAADLHLLTHEYVYYQFLKQCSTGWSLPKEINNFYTVSVKMNIIQNILVEHTDEKGLTTWLKA